MNKEFLAEQQRHLAAKVEIPECNGYQTQQGDIILALDIQYAGDEAHVGGDLQTFGGDHIGIFAGVTPATVPYVPSYFCFREGPPLLAFIEKLQTQTQLQPDIIVIDGHGIAHPRLFGVACWIGIATQKPTIGCAKDTLLQYPGQNLAAKAGSKVAVTLDGKLVGYALRRRTDIKPIFVSPGHLINCNSAVQLALDLPGKYRIPDPLRNADHAARAHCLGKQEPAWHDLRHLPQVIAPWS